MMTVTGDFDVLETLERDAALLIALWLEIYGGDPLPEPAEVNVATGTLASALVARLGAEFGASPLPLSNSQLAERLLRLGLELRDGRAHDGTTSSGGLVCVKGPDGAPGCCVRMAYHRGHGLV